MMSRFCPCCPRKQRTKLTIDAEASHEGGLCTYNTQTPSYKHHAPPRLSSDLFAVLPSSPTIQAKVCSLLAVHFNKEVDCERIITISSEAKLYSVVGTNLCVRAVPHTSFGLFERKSNAKSEHLRKEILMYRRLQSLRPGGRKRHFITFDFILSEAPIFVMLGPLARPLQKTDRLEGLYAAVCALHKLKIVHNDMKPDNLLVLGGAVKLADFGSAQTLAESKCLFVETTRKYYSPATKRRSSWEFPSKTDDCYAIYDFLSPLFGFRAFSWATAFDRDIYATYKVLEEFQRENTPSFETACVELWKKYSL